MSQQQDLWREIISSGLKGDLVVLFRKNPGIIDTVEGVARRLGVSTEAIEADTAELIKTGFLKKKQFGEQNVVYLDEKKDREIQESATKFLAAKLAGLSRTP